MGLPTLVFLQFGQYNGLRVKWKLFSFSLFFTPFHSLFNGLVCTHKLWWGSLVFPKKGKKAYYAAEYDEDEEDDDDDSTKGRSRRVAC